MYLRNPTYLRKIVTDGRLENEHGTKIRYREERESERKRLTDTDTDKTGKLICRWIN